MRRAIDRPQRGPTVCVHQRAQVDDGVSQVGRAVLQQQRRARRTCGLWCARLQRVPRGVPVTAPAGSNVGRGPSGVVTKRDEARLGGCRNFGLFDRCGTREGNGR